MTEASEGQRAGGDTSAGSPAASARGAGGDAGSSGFDSSSTVGPSEALIGPFTLREGVFGGGVALVFLGTLLPFIDGRVRYANFWSSEQLFFIGIGILVPVIALALLAARRLGSGGLRVGSLSVDQFASVSAVLAAVFFFLQTVTSFSAGSLLALIGALGMVAATVVGPFLPAIKKDFVDRPDVPAHTMARPMTAARPRPARPAKPAPDVAGEATADASSGALPGAPGPTPSGSGSSGSGRPADTVNPAAAAVRQNGAGLYGAGGAGAVGAGAAASGQSGLERSAAQASGPAAKASGPDAAVSDAVPAAAPSDAVPAAAPSDAVPEAGAHAVGPGAADSRDGSATDTPSRTAQTGPTDRTRVHDVVGDDATKRHAAAGSPSDERTHREPITATRSADEEPVVEAFWFAVGSPRPVVDEQTGREVFTLEPGDWEVGIEDRGREFLVQDKRTGAVGVLRDLRNIERAPRD